MAIIGWIRRGDIAACGATVMDGIDIVRIAGKPIAYRGARMACPRQCVIAEGHMAFTLPNGQCAPHHGHKTSGGCPLLSSLNGTHGVDMGRGSTRAQDFALNVRSEWVIRPDASVRDTRFDERPQLVASCIDGIPYFVELMDGRTFSGRVGPDGLLPRIDTRREDEYTVYWGDEALARSDRGAG